jgi:hemicentin
MRCDASGSPTPEIHWYRRGVRLSAQAVAGVTVDANTLTLANVQSGEHGAYMCRAINAAGQDELVIKLTVVGRAMIAHGFFP